MVNGVPWDVSRPKPLGPMAEFWPWDFPRDSIHHDTHCTRLHAHSLSKATTPIDKTQAFSYIAVAFEPILLLLDQISKTISSSGVILYACLRCELHQTSDQVVCL